MWKSELIYTIKIVLPGKSGVWFNSRIGQIFDAKMAMHPTDQNVKGFIIRNVWFIPSVNCIILKGSQRYKRERTYTYTPSKKKNGFPINVENTSTGDKFTFISIREASRFLNMPHTTIRNALMKKGIFENFKFTVIKLSS